MKSELHHVAVYVKDMDRVMYLFQDLLGFELLWRVARAGGHELATMVGMPEMEVELAYLQSHTGGLALELVRLIRPNMDETPAHYGGPGSIHLSLIVEDLDTMHQRLTESGWPPFTPPMDAQTPGGDSIRVFFFRIEDGLTIELFEQK